MFEIKEVASQTERAGIRQSSGGCRDASTACRKLAEEASHGVNAAGAASRPLSLCCMYLCLVVVVGVVVLLFPEPVQTLKPVLHCRKHALGGGGDHANHKLDLYSQ